MHRRNKPVRAILTDSISVWIVPDMSVHCICKQLILGLISLQTCHLFLILGRLAASFGYQLQLAVFDELVEQELAVEVVLGLIVSQVGNFDDLLVNTDGQRKIVLSFDLD